MSSLLTKAKAVHFIGIGGIGISAIARMLLFSGVRVSGSDSTLSHIVRDLSSAGAKIFPSHSTDNILPETDLVIYSVAIGANNPELVEAKRRKLQILSYPEALGVLTKDKYTIAVAGTHGKTTTTAMIADVLIAALLSPSVVVGSLLSGGRSNFVYGRGKYFLVEACEYKRSFLNLSPRVAVVTNIDNDHLDYYGSLSGVISGFNEFVRKVPKDGFIVCNPALASVREALSEVVATVIDFREFRGEVPKLLVPGDHNRENAAAALSVVDLLNIPKSVSTEALSRFSGTWRRFECRGFSKGGSLVYDDYGHHPTEISATLSGAREVFQTEKIIVVFQPHLYSRTKDHLATFGKCFRQASEVILLPIYPAREIDPGDINSEMMAEEIKKNGKPAIVARTFAEAAAEALGRAGQGDLILTLGAGEANKVADLLINVESL
jgi:UDP-N-acetylmuramate--alanine ligase